MVVQLSNSNGGDPVPLPDTNAGLLPNVNNPDIVHLQVNRRWNLGKEDFLHFIGTSHAQMGRADERQNPQKSPSLTRQEPYVQAIVSLLGGDHIPPIEAVRNVQNPALTG
jgi:hypothetical protein